LTDNSARKIVDIVKPQHFANGAVGELWQIAKNYVSSFSRYPSIAWLIDQAQRVQNPLVAHMAQQLATTRVTDTDAIKAEVKEYFHMQMFVETIRDCRDHLQNDNLQYAYDLLRTRTHELDNLDFRHEERSFYDEDFISRFMANEVQSRDDLLISGFPQIDEAIGGGLYAGFLGCWIAPAKTGKTTALLNLALNLVRLNRVPVVHFVLEGTAKETYARMDAAFLDASMADIRRGNVPPEVMAAAYSELQFLKRRLIVRTLSDQWDNTVEMIEHELDLLERREGIVARAITVDYADLLEPRRRTNNTYQDQINVYRDLKTLCMKRKIVCWTAAQAQRPSSQHLDDKEHIVRSINIADSYGKVRICDFVGSINSTEQERNGVEQSCRIYIEMLRNGRGNMLFRVPTNLSHQKIYFERAVPIQPDERKKLKPQDIQHIQGQPVMQVQAPPQNTAFYPNQIPNSTQWYQGQVPLMTTQQQQIYHQQQYPPSMPWMQSVGH
jgi:hypothetical protein